MGGGQGGLKSRAAKKKSPGVASAPQQAKLHKTVSKRIAPRAEQLGTVGGPAKRRAEPNGRLPEHVPLGGGALQSSPEPPLDSKTATQQSKRETFGFGKPAGAGGAVVYLGHIPHGFYEEQMKGFFSQFGTVTRLRLARNRKTGRSKHFAFIEFEHREVAEVVAKAMHGYLLYSKILECRVLPREQTHPRLFKARPVDPDRPADAQRNSERKRFNQPRTAEQREQLTARRAAMARRRQRQWEELGIEYEFAPPVAARVSGGAPKQTAVEGAADEPARLARKKGSVAARASAVERVNEARPSEKETAPSKKPAVLKRASAADKPTLGKKTAKKPKAA